MYTYSIIPSQAFPECPQAKPNPKGTGSPMLILNRKAGQSILITNEIQIIILNGLGDIRLGIEAPKDMQILRGEIVNRYRSPQINPQPTIITYRGR